MRGNVSLSQIQEVDDSTLDGGVKRITAERKEVLHTKRTDMV